MKNRSIIFSFLVLSIFSVTDSSVNAMELSTISDMHKIQATHPSLNSGVNIFHDGKSFYIKEKHSTKTGTFL